MIQLLAPEANDVQRRLLMHFMGVAADAPQIVGFLRATGAIDASAQARAIRVPTLVIASDTNTTVPLASSRRVASLVPGARLEIVEGASQIGACMLDPRVMQLVPGFLAEETDAGLR